MSDLEVLFAPAEFSALAQRDLGNTVCVVFDVLRATSSMITALSNGAQSIRPVCEISEALALRQRETDALLAGERDGLRIGRDLTGGVEFDFGNSPREFTAERVCGRRIIMTTTNGTRALRACHGARMVLVGSFLNLSAVAAALRSPRPDHVILVCSGTHEEAALEDALAAGAFCDLVWPDFTNRSVADSAVMARQIFRGSGSDLATAMQPARNARRLSGIPELADDVAVCLRRDITSTVGLMQPDGCIVSQTRG